MEIELYKKLYQNLVNYASVAGIDKAALQKYFIPEGNTSSKSILFRLCSSLQNSGMMRNSIKFNDTKNLDNRKVIEKVMFGYNTQKAAEHYPDCLSKGTQTPLSPDPVFPQPAGILYGVLLAGCCQH